VIVYKICAAAVGLRTDGLPGAGGVPGTGMRGEMRIFFPLLAARRSFIFVRLNFFFECLLEGRD
jgi:hypothetical protein